MLSYFETEKISAVLIRPDLGSYVDGEWTPGDTDFASIEIIAPQPLRADEMQMLPEGERTINHMVTWMTPDAQIWPVIPGTATNDSDIIAIGATYYKVVQVSNRSVLGNYYRIVMRETDYTVVLPPT